MESSWPRWCHRGDCAVELGEVLVSFYCYGNLVWYGMAADNLQSAADKVHTENYQNNTEHYKPTDTLPGRHLDLLLAAEDTQDTKDSFQPAHHLLELLPPRKRYRSIKTCTTALVSSFYPKTNTYQHIQR